MSNLEQEEKPKEYQQGADNLIGAQRVQADLASRRKVLKGGIKFGAGFAALSAVGEYYLITHTLPEKANEAEREHPRPSEAEYAQAQDTVELYKRRRALFQECQDVYPWDKCQPLR